MAQYRNHLPQLSGDIFLNDAGLETDLIFNHGIDIPEFAAHTLLPNPATRAKLEAYFDEFIALATLHNVGIILDAPTWKAHSHWKDDLNCQLQDLEQANHEAVAFVQALREKSTSDIKIVLNGLTGPCGDAYNPDNIISVEDSAKYHSTQIQWLADTNADMVSALTFTQSTEAAGYAIAAAKIGMPCVISFTVETDGKLPTGQKLADAVKFVDATSENYPAYYMVNCAHPDHFSHVFDGSAWTKRIRGLRCNASRQSHAELDACEVLDDGNPDEFGRLYRDIFKDLPWLNIFGGCCGSDIRHIRKIIETITAKPA